MPGTGALPVVWNVGTWFASVYTPHALPLGTFIVADGTGADIVKLPAVAPPLA
jgi:hypothetical protein